MSRTAGRPATRRRSRVSLFLIVALLAVGSVFAHYWVRTLHYYPTARIETPAGYAFTVVQDVRASRSECGDANDRFLSPLDRICERCKVAYARCLTKLEGVELTLVTEDPPPQYLVRAPGVRMAVTGPLARRKEVCEEIAESLVKGGLPTASCAYARGAATSQFPASGGAP
jgi:hypothetical protein